MAKKLHDVTPINTGDMEMPHLDRKPVYPSFSIRELDVPEIKDKKIDDEFEVTIKVRVEGIRKDMAEEIVANVEMLKIGINK